MKDPDLANSLVGVFTRFMFLVVLLFWTDSTALLHYMQNYAKCFSVFAPNFLAVIKQNTTFKCWHCVPSNLNPVDLASSGIQANLSKLKKWLEGPDFFNKTWHQVANKYIVTSDSAFIVFFLGKE